MSADIAYQVNKDYSGSFEKKGALGMWGKKFGRLQGCKFYLSDNESAAANVTIEVDMVLLAENGDLQCLTIAGKPEPLLLKCESAAKAEEWYHIVWAALEFAGKVKPRDCGLPSADPRNGLPFIDVPPVYRAKFTNLERAVLYWFAPIKKFGLPSAFTKKHQEENRVAFVSTQAFYVTKPDSELTRCMKVSGMSKIFVGTGIDPKLSGDPWCLIKMELPDYDFLLSSPNVDKLVKVLTALYKQIKKVDLPVETVAAVSDPKVQLQLERPSGFEMSMVVPSTREKLKKALDDFAAKHGISFTSTGTAVAATGGEVKKKRSSTIKGQAPVVGAGPAGAGAPAPAAAPAGGGGGADPLFVFLEYCELSKHYQSLKKQMVDLDVLDVMDADDYVNFGITDKAEVTKIRAKLQDKELIESIQAGEKPAAAAPSPSHKDPAAGTKPAPKAAAADDIDLSDDDIPAPGAAKKPVIDLDELDDLDIDGPVSSTSAAKFTIDLSDDDLDVGPPPTAAAKKPISISDDDDI